MATANINQIFFNLIFFSFFKDARPWEKNQNADGDDGEEGNANDDNNNTGSEDNYAKIYSLVRHDDYDRPKKRVSGWVIQWWFE